MGGAKTPLTLFCDLDGTLLPHVYNDADGRVVAPTLKNGPAFTPILKWLELGGRLVAVTGARRRMQCCLTFINAHSIDGMHYSQ